MKTAKIVIAVLVLALALIGASVVFVQAGIKTPINPIGEALSSAFTNAAIDAADLKGKAESALEDNADAIALATGLSNEEVDKMISDLGIEDWQVISLPDDAIATDTHTFKYRGQSYNITAYTNKSIVTIETNGLKTTFLVPDSAQGYVDYLKYF